MPDESVKRGKTGKYVRQGHTAGEYGNDPSKGSPSNAAKDPKRDLTP